MCEKNLMKLYPCSEEQVKTAMTKLSEMDISLPMWLALDTGTRFGRVTTKGSANDVWEAMAQYKWLYDVTGIGSSVVWGSQVPNDVDRIKAESEKNGLHIDTVHAYFGGEAPSYGSVANANPVQRDLALAQIEDCIRVMRATGAKNLSLWFKDGTNYPGQADFTKRYRRVVEVLKKAYAMMDDDMTMIIEYKLFEPAVYHTDIADWGTAVALCSELGDRAKVIMDLGHHAQATNIPATLASVFRSGKMGAIHFNDSKYADDDLIVGSLDPYRLFLIFHEMISQERYHGHDISKIPLIVDQSLVVEDKLPGILYTIENMQIAYAKALLVDHEKLVQLQDSNDIIGAARVLKEAYECDVRPLLKAVREQKGLPLDPFAALKERA